MKISILILSLLNPLISVLSQDISAQIKDSKSLAPIRYVNIGIVGKNIGTVSDSLGNFKLSLLNALDTDILRISSISFITKDYKIGDLRTVEFPKIILMNEEIVQLKEVALSDEKREPIELGLKKKYGYPIPLYKGAVSKIAFPQKSYRHEIVTRFTNSKTMVLDSIQLNFAECNADSIKLRLNIYSVNGDVIKNSLSKPIYITFSKTEALNYPTINLIKQHIKANSDFLVTIENYKQIKDDTLYFFANFKRKGKSYPTYYRHSSQSNWMKLKSKKNKTIGISILTFGH